MFLADSTGARRRVGTASVATLDSYFPKCEKLSLPSHVADCGQKKPYRAKHVLSPSAMLRINPVAGTPRAQKKCLSLQTDGARQSFSNLFFIQSFKYLCVVFTALALASAALAGQATSPTAAGATASAHGQVTPSRTGTGAGGIRGHGFVHDAGGNFTTIDVPGATSLTLVFGINTNGATAGGYVDARGTLHGFLRCDRTITTIDVPGATSTGLSGINDRGDIVGGYFDDARRHGFMFSNGRFTTTTAAGAILETFPFDIDDRGRIVGFYF